MCCIFLINNLLHFQVYCDYIVNILDEIPIYIQSIYKLQNYIQLRVRSMFQHLGHSSPSLSKHLGISTSSITRQDEVIRLSNKHKTIILIQNGQPAKIIRVEYSRNVTKQDIIKNIQKYWGVSANLSKNLRIFSTQGVQFLQEDLLYVKSGERLYISRGEEFDSNSNFGEFQIIKKLGEGGFGSVDLAKNIITGEYAAIKILKTSKNSSFADIDMIFRQAQNLKALNHPNIVKIMNCYALKDMKVIIVMQYLEGGQLLDLLKEKKKLEQSQSRLYFKQIISAVSYCHRQGIIHRDLKLQNILFKNSKVLKVADFGISGVADRFNHEADWGTIRYMPPQVLSGKHKVNSPGVDVWACGVILYQLVTGQFPFNGGSTNQIVDNVLKKPVVFSSNCLLTQKCKFLIQRMLQKNPSQRISVSDIQLDPWLISAQQKPQNVLKTVGSQQISIRISDLKKDQRKSIILAKPLLNVRIPKRLQKQKDQLLQQLRGYNKGHNRKIIKSQTKLFPILNKNQKRLKYEQNKFDVKIDDSNKKKQLLRGWK